MGERVDLKWTALRDKKAHKVWENARTALSCVHDRIIALIVTREDSEGTA